MEKKYYVYYWNREDGTPYYIGKGCGDRAYRKGRDYKPPVERIQILKENLTEDEALELEIELIAKFGRKDLGTGILRNKTDGGDGMSSEDATRLNNKRVAEGTHPMFKEHNKEKLRQRNKETGSFKNPELQRELFKRRTKESLIEGGKKAAETTRKNGTHPWKTENRSELHKKNLEASYKSPERSKKLSEKLKGHPALTAPKSEEWKKKASIAAKNRKTVMVECDVCGRVMSNRMIARHKRGKQCQK